MIDLDALKRSAEAEGGEGDAVVERSWLAQVLKELTAGRQAAAELQADRAVAGLCFGLKPDQRL